MSGRKKKRLAADAYLNAVRPLAAELIEYLTGSEEYEIGCETARGCGFRDATILFVNSAGKKYGISKAGTSISDDRLCSSRGFVIRVYDGALSAEYSGCELEKSIFPDIAGTLLRIVSETKRRAGKRRSGTQCGVLRSGIEPGPKRNRPPDSEADGTRMRLARRNRRKTLRG